MDCCIGVLLNEFMNRREFLGLLENFCRRPALYIGFTDYKSAICWLKGFDMAHHGELFGGFGDWLSHKLLINHSGWWWPRMILHMAGSEENALKTLAVTYREFASIADGLNYYDLKNDRNAMLTALYGKTSHEPESLTNSDLTYEASNL